MARATSAGAQSASWVRLAVLTLAGASACAGTGGAAGVDGSAEEGGVDASVGTGADSGADSSADSSVGTGADSSADSSADAGADSSADADADANTDAAPDASPPGQTLCTTLPPLDAGTCAATKGSAALLIEGNVLAPDTIYVGGQVAIAATGDIACVGCNCADGGETVVACPGATISPGLIDVHDHITDTENAPAADTGERYDDRQQWREGLDGHTKLTIPGGASADQVHWGELRHVMAGTTSLVGAGGQPGLVRNLDQSSNEGGLGLTAVFADTFPLGDTDGTRRTGDCNYDGGTVRTVAAIMPATTRRRAEPHTSRRGRLDGAQRVSSARAPRRTTPRRPGFSNDPRRRQRRPWCTPWREWSRRTTSRWPPPARAWSGRLARTSLFTATRPASRRPPGSGSTSRSGRTGSRAAR